MDVDRGREHWRIGGGSTWGGGGAVWETGEERTGDGSSNRVESGRNRGKLPSTA